MIKRKNIPTLVIKGKIIKDYNHWVKVYDEAEDLRNSNYGIKTIYRGHEMEDESTIHLVMNTPSMEVLHQHMENKAELITIAGGSANPEDNTITLCSDKKWSKFINAFNKINIFIQFFLYNFSCNGIGTKDLGLIYPQIDKKPNNKVFISNFAGWESLTSNFQILLNGQSIGTLGRDEILI